MVVADVEQWFAKSYTFHYNRNTLSNQCNEYDYDDSEYYYSVPPDIPQKSVPTYLIIEHKQRNGCNLKLMSLGCLLITATVLFILSLVYYLAWNSKDVNFKNTPRPTVPEEKHFTESMCSSSPDTNVIRSKVNIEIMATFLLTLLITKRKLCLFEAGTDRSDESKNEYRKEHIESARLLQFTNLSVNGTPIHPIQFQQYARSLGVDTDCYVIIYDRGEVVWATHAFWIFTLFGHQKVSLYSGGINEWKKLKENSAQYRTESGDGTYLQRSGHFRAEWNTAIICTFDDVLANTKLRTHDLVDGQDREQYEGISSEAVYGHIQSAINIPAKDIYEWQKQKWHDELNLKFQFRSMKLKVNRSVIVYSSSPIHASLTWFALKKCGYNSTIYLGSWPEWLIRAPEFLKIIPKRKF